MAVCDETCSCNAEGARGLVVTGTGEAADPFVVSPDDNRTIPSTYETYADLPTLADEEFGQLAFVKDTGLVYVWSDSTSALEDGWQVVAPDWDAVALSDTAVAATGVATTIACFDLRDGRWDILASGYLDIDVETTTTTVVRLELIDSVSSTVYDTKVCSLPNDGAGPEPRTQPFTLQRMVTSGPGSVDPVDGDKSIAVRMTRDSADTSVGDLTQTAIRAVRVASHGAF